MDTSLKPVRCLLQDCDALWEDFHNKLVDSTLLNLDAYLQHFPDLKVRKGSAQNHFALLSSEQRRLVDGSGTRGQEEPEAHRLRQRSPSRGDAADVRDEERPQDDEGEPRAGDQRLGPSHLWGGCRRRTS